MLTISHSGEDINRHLAGRAGVTAAALWWHRVRPGGQDSVEERDSAGFVERSCAEALTRTAHWKPGLHWNILQGEADGS